MADNQNYTMHLRRRREGRTNYHKRLELLKSGEHRAVVRMSNKHAQVQIVAYNPKGDEVVTSAFSKQLTDYGWDEHTGNLPAAYLTGFLAGRKALENGIETVVSDLGAFDQQYASRAYAALKGLQDAGLNLNLGEKALPSEDRLEGKHTANYESEGLDETFEQVRDTITEEHEA